MVPDTDPDQDSDLGFWWLKIKKSMEQLEKRLPFFIKKFKIAIYLSLGLHKGRPN